MKKVAVKDAGIKLNGTWFFKGQEVFIDDDEYEKNKEYVTSLEDLTESNERKIEIIVEDETIDIDKLKSDVEVFVQNYNTQKYEKEITNTTTDDEVTLEELKAKAIELGIDVSRMTNIENIKKKIEDAKAPKFGEKEDTDTTTDNE